mmetsp:Transcript_57547/g.106315  ORF Transcript_57547/g.106315 Transcript_57547/m.106315 type:complete len:378 (-) Transcript_57547:113-1246(-)
MACLPVERERPQDVEAPAAAPPTGDDLPSLLIVVRHGERLDEADKRAWALFVQKHRELAADPPLTKKGWQQARTAGGKLRDTLAVMERRDVTRIYSSPTSRTLSTAAGLAEELGVKQVTPAYGLNCCAAAVRDGVGHRGMSRKPTRETIGKINCSWPPVGVPDKVNELNRHRDGFLHALRTLAEGEGPNSTVVLVSHREGIFQLQDCLGLPKRQADYCGVEYLQYSHKTKSLSLWPLPQGERTVPAQPKADLGSGLQAILASGTGKLVVHRQGTRGKEESTLWTVPGGRASPAVVRDGEIVELCSVPQAAEGGAGDFVLVQCYDGRRGWLRLQYVHLPAEGPGAMHGHHTKDSAVRLPAILAPCCKGFLRRRPHAVR